MVLYLHTSSGNPSGVTGRLINEERAETLLSAINLYGWNLGMFVQVKSSQVKSSQVKSSKYFNNFDMHADR